MDSFNIEPLESRRHLSAGPVGAGTGNDILVFILFHNGNREAVTATSYVAHSRGMVIAAESDVAPPRGSVVVDNRE